MSYGFTASASGISSTMDVFDMLAYAPAAIADAFTTIPKLSRTGAPGFVILVANSADSVAAAAASAQTLKDSGFQIITIAFKSTGSFDSLGSQASYNFQIRQDSEKQLVAAQIGYILKTWYCGSITTPKPNVCPGRNVYNGDLAIAFEFIKNSDGSQKIVNFLNNTLLKNPDSYGLTNDVNNNQPSKLELLPYPGTDNYPKFGYGSVHSSADINAFITAYQLVQSDSPDPSIKDALQYIESSPGPSSFQAVLIFGSDATDVPDTVQYANALKNAGYLVITIAQTASAAVFRPLASGDQYALQIGTGNDDAVAAQIASLLLHASSTCFDDGSICPNQQTVFKGQVGVIFELLPSSATTQQATINDFVENLLLNSNFYGLALDNLTGENRTLVTALPYPRTSEYKPLGYGSARSQADFKAQVDAYNAGVLPVSKVGDLSDALLYVTSVLPAGGVPSALIIVGNSQSLLDDSAPLLAEALQETYSIFTVSVGTDAVDLSSLASGPDYAFNGNTQQIADQIAQKLETSSPAVYCPPRL